jgi:hypothetical protein
LHFVIGVSTSSSGSSRLSTTVSEGTTSKKSGTTTSGITPSGSTSVSSTSSGRSTTSGVTTTPTTATTTSATVTSTSRTSIGSSTSTYQCLVSGMENPSLISDSQIKVSPAPVFGEGEIKDLRPSSPVGGYDSNSPKIVISVSLNPKDVVQSVELNASPETPVVFSVVLRNENGIVVYTSEVGSC